MIDAQHNDHLDLMTQELHKVGLRLNQKKPDIAVKKTGQGGILVTATTKLNYVNEKLVKSIASEYVVNAEITIREDITDDQLIDVLVSNRVYMPSLVLINKIDLISEKRLRIKIQSIKNSSWDVIGISALDGTGLNKLKEKIYSELCFIRVFMKPVGKQADMDEPLILKEGNTVEDACKKLHRDFKEKFRYASVSGPSAKHNAQKIGLDHVLKDGDVLTIVISR
jgi:hypothetical protein